MNSQEKKRQEMTLRLPSELKQKLEQIASTNKRSLTREIEVALEEYVKLSNLIDNSETNKVS